jgi:septum formation protein
MNTLFQKPLGLPLILASASPRRQELLKRVGLAFTLNPSHADEPLIEGEAPGDTALRLARLKGEAQASQHPGALVLSADTLVVHQGRVLGKPQDPQAAEEMLAALSGCWHEVYTAWAIHLLDMSGQLHVHQAVDRVDVRFHDMEPADLAAYVASGEPMDKAGAYGIQDLGSLLVAEIRGDYFSVMGLPISRVLRDLRACEARWTRPVC